jgi:hypothetical protein
VTYSLFLFYKKYSPCIENADISRRGSATLVTESPHKYKVTENTDKKNLNSENRKTKQKKVSTRRNNFSSSSSAEGEELA